MTNAPNAVLISLREIHLVLEQQLHAYLNKTSWRSPVRLEMVFGKPKFLTALEPDGNLAGHVIKAIIHDLTHDTSSDMRNAGTLWATEEALKHHFVDERTAHEMAENLFGNLVNTLGEHLPDLTFNNHTDFRYQLNGSDLLVWRPGMPAAEMARTYV